MLPRKRVRQPSCGKILKCYPDAREERDLCGVRAPAAFAGQYFAELSMDDLRAKASSTHGAYFDGESPIVHDDYCNPKSISSAATSHLPGWSGPSVVM